MQNPYFNERRQYSRFPLRLSIRLRQSNPGPDEIEALTNDISSNGIGLVTDKQLPKNSSLDIWIEIPSDGTHLHTYGKVVWSKAYALKCRAGICLDTPELNPVSLALKAIRAQIRIRHRE